MSPCDLMDSNTPQSKAATYSISTCNTERTSQTGIFPITIPPTTIFAANASSMFDHQEGGISIWIMSGPHHAWLFQTIRDCEWQSWVEDVDYVSLGAYVEEGVAVCGIPLLTLAF